MAQRSEDGVGKTSENVRAPRARLSGLDPIRDLHTGQRRVNSRINRPDTRKHLNRQRQKSRKTTCFDRGVHTRTFPPLQELDIPHRARQLLRGGDAVTQIGDRNNTIAALGATPESIN